MSRYRIPKSAVRVEYRQSNSRFLATIGPASSMEEAKAFIQSIRDEMPDATHHVYAFKAGFGASVTEGMSDDGEPAGTSGPPTLAVLRGSGIGDVVLVITRYYGGTRLGTGGLVTAYGNAARMAVEAVDTIEKVDRRRLALTIPYPLYDRVRQFLDGHEALMEREEFGAEVELVFLYPVENLTALADHVRNLSAGRLAPREAK